MIPPKRACGVTPAMVPKERVELSTSRLSVVHSNQLSYFGMWSSEVDSNQPPSDYKSPVLASKLPEEIA